MFDLDEYREIICSMYTDRKMTVGEISKELKICSPATISRYMKGLRQMQINAQKINVSSIEIKVKEQLDQIGIRYIHQKSVKDGKFIVDFYIPSLRLVIECNGDYWHRLPERVERDKELKRYVESTNRKIIFIWEHEIRDDWFWIGDYLIVDGGDL